MTSKFHGGDSPKKNYLGVLHQNVKHNKKKNKNSGGRDNSVDFRF